MSHGGESEPGRSSEKEVGDGEDEAFCCRRSLHFSLPPGD